MKIIVTGTSGFIGGHLLQAARAAYGDEVTAFSSRPSEGRHIVYVNRANFGLTLADLGLVEEAEVLIHAGAFTPKIGAEANQVEGCNGNITFSEMLLSLPWRSLQKIIFLSTLDVYANVAGPISENTPVIPESLYGLSKLYGERMMSLYAAGRRISCQVLRIGHVYGPGEERYAKVIPRTIENILAGKAVELYGVGAEVRSFIYIDDVATAILKAIELQEDPGVINVVGGNAIKISDLLEKLIAIGGRGTRVVRRELSGATRDFVFDNTKLKRYLLPKETDLVSGLMAEFQYMETLNRNTGD